LLPGLVFEGPEKKQFITFEKLKFDEKYTKPQPDSFAVFSCSIRAA
jgi:hypothetical protein